MGGPFVKSVAGAHDAAFIVEQIMFECARGKGSLGMVTRRAFVIWRPQARACSKLDFPWLHSGLAL